MIYVMREALSLTDVPYRYDGAERWILPALDACPCCGDSLGSLGYHFPCVDLSTSKYEKYFRTAWPIDYDLYKALVSELQCLVPPGTPIKPCACIGPFDGYFRGQLHDFIWGLDLMLIRSDALESLRKARLSLPVTVTANARLAKRYASITLEDFCLDYYALLAPSTYTDNMYPPCPVCAMRDKRYRVPSTLYLLADSIPHHVDIFCGRDDAFIYVTQAFVDAVSHLGLTGAIFTPVEVRDEPIDQYQWLQKELAESKRLMAYYTK